MFKEKDRTPAELHQLAKSLVAKATDHSQPNLLATAIATRDIVNLQINSKMMAAFLAQAAYGQKIRDFALPEAPGSIGAKGRVCKQADFSQPWFLYWIDQLKCAPHLHRKLWEDAYVLQCLWERGFLQQGKRAIGFAVGAEQMPSLFARYGVDVLATDLSHDDERSRGWSLTQQHARDLEQLWKPNLIERKPFFERCSFEPMDMSKLPQGRDAQFDFCWSICSFEHLGTIAAGLDFVVNAMRFVKPGGVAVHTTEYNVSDGETIDNWNTVLYQRKHFEALAARLPQIGCRLVEIDFDPGSEMFDSYIDVPPFPHDAGVGVTIPAAPHIKLSVDGFVATSVALIVEKL
jgi:SAM-dependent methyltransferase